MGRFIFLSIVQAILIVLACVPAKGQETDKPSFKHDERAHNQVPERIRSSTNQHPAWVSLEETLNKNGDLDPQYFSERQVSRIHRYMERQGSRAKINQNGELDCSLTMYSHRDVIDEKSSKNIYDLLDNSSEIFLGEIVSLTPGFFEGIATTLVGLKIEQVINAAPYSNPSKVIYFTYPRAYFKINGIPFCGDDQNNIKNKVRVGRKAILFCYWDSIGEEVSFYWIRPQMLILEGDDCSADYPPHLDEIGLKNNSFQDLINIATPRFAGGKTRLQPAGCWRTL